MINRKARPMEPVRLSLAPYDDVSKRGKPTTLTLTIQSNTCALCARPSSAIFVSEDGSAFDLCRGCYVEVSMDTPAARARQGFAALFKETP
jgi:hypothetical protein